MTQGRCLRASVRTALGENARAVFERGVGETERTGVERHGRNQNVVESTDFDSARRQVDARHVATLAVTPGHHTAALANGHQLGRVTRPEFLAGHSVDDGRCRQGRTLAQEDLTTLGGFDETDVLAIRLVPRAKSETLGLNADVGLFEVANGQEQHGQLLFSQIPQDVTLVLLVIRAAHQEVAAVTTFDLRVMPGRHGVESQASRAIEEQVELDVSIALDAGIR